MATPKKARLKAVNGSRKGVEIEVLFNPGEYTHEKGNQYQSNALPGLSTPIVQFVNGNADTLTLDLLFDSYTYEASQPVTNWTSQVAQLMEIDPTLHAPPLVEFVWGRFSFQAILERVSQRFTMFLEDGTPVRATLGVTFKEYKTIERQLQEVPRESSDVSKRHVVLEGETLWGIAHAEYGDPASWRAIASHNRLDDPRRLDPGLELLLPPLESSPR